MVVLDVNPLEDIYQTDRVFKVMQTGRLFDAATLAEEHRGNYKPEPFYYLESVEKQ